MTKVLRWLGGVGFAAALGVLLFGLSSSFSATDAAAESPPAPPARFTGTVTIDGQPAAAGTTIRARIGSADCGVTSVFKVGAASRYLVDVPALDPGATPNCGTDGATVSFWIGDFKAAESGAWKSYQLNELNLSYTTPTPTPVPTVSTTATTTATATTPGGGGGGATPRPPSTGESVMGDSGSSAALWVFAAFGVGVLAFGAAGISVARRSR